MTRLVRIFSIIGNCYEMLHCKEGNLHIANAMDLVRISSKSSTDRDLCYELYRYNYSVNNLST